MFVDWSGLQMGQIMSKIGLQKVFMLDLSGCCLVCLSCCSRQ